MKSEGQIIAPPKPERGKGEVGTVLNLSAYLMDEKPKCL